MCTDVCSDDDDDDNDDEIISDSREVHQRLMLIGDSKSILITIRVNDLQHKTMRCNTNMQATHNFITKN